MQIDTVGQNMAGLADKPEAQLRGVKVLNCKVFKIFLEAIMCDLLQSNLLSHLTLSAVLDCPHSKLLQGVHCVVHFQMIDGL
jgi:hypothetical protein